MLLKAKQTFVNKKKSITEVHIIRSKSGPDSNLFFKITKSKKYGNLTGLIAQGLQFFRIRMPDLQRNENDMLRTTVGFNQPLKLFYVDFGF